MVERCDRESTIYGLCQTDSSMGYLKTRYYDITVTASDSAGNQGSDTCRVVIVPPCNPHEDYDCEQYNGYYYKLSAVTDSIMQSQVLNEVAQDKFVWKSGLVPPLSEHYEAKEEMFFEPLPPSKGQWYVDWVSTCTFICVYAVDCYTLLLTSNALDLSHYVGQFHLSPGLQKV